MKFLISTAFLFFGQIIFAQKEMPQIDEKIKNETITNIVSAIKKNYVYPEKVLEIENYLYKQNKSKVYKSTVNPQDFAEKLVSNILSVQNDKHLRIVYDPDLEKDILLFNESKKNAEKISNSDIEKEKAVNFYFRKLEILPSNIGYVEFTNFSLPNDEARKTIRSAMQFVSNTDALIIDLRNNRGGNAVTANEILGYFFNSKIKTGRSFNKIENKWSDNYIQNQDITLNMPLYILTSKKTYSAGEGFAYILKNQRNAKIIGEATNGGAHLTRSFSLGNGFVGFIPYLRSENEKTKTDWEGTGVIPDINSDEKSSLITAQNEILSAKLSSAKDESEKRKIIWLINYNRSLTSDVDVNSSDLDRYTGRFAEFEITKQDNTLFFRDVNQQNRIPFKMIPVTNTLFQVGMDYQIEFLQGEDKTCNSIKISWNDGWTEEIKREHVK
ncbi:S41 family peptidase [Chryseobacterium sp. GP-SGM7]|uniref:S41 family peptidase n=1 Tax=Chryseobacterium sp. GP-SGM7 TaxID=3411323 RepID=UPI003B965C16